MKNISIKLKLLIIIFCSMAVVSFIVFGFSIKSIYDLSNEKIKSYRIESYHNKELELKNYVTLAKETVNTFYKKIDKEKIKSNEKINQLKEEALNTIHDMRYANNNYFWINDSNAKMIMHSIKPELNGKDLSSTKDPAGKTVFVEMAKVANKNINGGTIDYQWAKAGKDTPQPKLSYVMKFEPWDWIIGTGIYVDEIEDNILKMEEKTLDDILLLMFQIFVGYSIALVVIIFVSLQVTKKIILTPLTNFQNGLLDFFQYLNREKDTIEILENTSKDELGIMTSIVNENILKTQSGIDEDRKFIDETIHVLSEFKQGDLSQRISTHVNNPALTELKKVLDSMGEHMEENINNVLKILEEYANYNYINKVQDSNVKNHLLRLSQGVNSLGDSITNMLIENKKVGTTLNNSSQTLLNNVTVLNDASNNAAASLEETAAALEEITSTIVSNTENVSNMALFANKVVTSVNEGNAQAQETAQSMVEINEQVNAITDAITIIDQIAFQTNILSLNAAVEAATAGEAGKGFAVVAQEVRNLASRSAEAAKEIKNLVENANAKTNSGKEISNNMIQGYTILNDNIGKTIELIKQVEIASKEQQSGIEQINTAVADQDRQTQKIASASGQTYDIATQTSEISNEIVRNVDSKKFNEK